MTGLLSMRIPHGMIMSCKTKQKKNKKTKTKCEAALYHQNGNKIFPKNIFYYACAVHDIFRL